MMISADDQARVDAIEEALLARWPETRIAPTLERISALMDILGSPQLTYPTIHIAGTNGKTSTSRMIDSLLFATGMRTGRFTSPHLESYLERIAINGHSIDAKEIIFAYNDIAAYLDLMDEKYDNPISFFEAITALAFVAFAEHPIDVGVIEVGMGGTWDATNVIDADVSVVMPIDYDHMEYLGNTLTEIAATKAGVIKEGGFVVLAQQKPEAAVELLRRAAEVGADIAREGIEYELLSRAVAIGGQLISVKGINDTYEDIFIPLHGKHQALNAASALVAVEAFFGGTLTLDIDAVREGFGSVTSPGRLEIVRRSPTVIVDAAHNPHGASVLATALEESFTFEQVIGVISVMADKDVIGVLQALETVMTDVVVTWNGAQRAMLAPEIAQLAIQVFGEDRVHVESNLTSAIDRAIAMADEAGMNGVGVVVTGSVVTAAAARKIMGKTNT
jgi:dihydrofolate synthase/folylpolyglutamate synthase